MNHLKINSDAWFFLIVAVFWVFRFVNSWRNRQSIKESTSRDMITPEIESEPESFKPKIQNQMYAEKTIDKQSFRVKESPILKEEKSSYEVPDEKKAVTDPLELIASNNSPIVSAMIFHEILSPPKSER